MNIVMHRNMESPLCRWKGSDVIAALIRYRRTHFRLLGSIGTPSARVFLKYGDADRLAEIIAEGAKDIFFQNKKTVMTQNYLMMPENPESFVLLERIVLAFPEMRGQEEYLTVQDCWGDSFRYPFSAGQKQVFRIQVLLDKIERSAKACRIGHKPEDIAFAREQRIPLVKTARK